MPGRALFKAYALDNYNPKGRKCMFNIAGLEVNVSEVIAHQRISGTFDKEVRAVVERKMAAGKARDAGLEVTDDELQNAFDVWRVARKLHMADDTVNWLKEADLSIEDIEDYLETTILVSKFKDRLHIECDINKYLDLPQTRELIRDLVYDDWLRQTFGRTESSETTRRT
jgi:hypothetical protein